MTLAPKLDRELRCIMEQFTEPVEGQNDGQHSPATHGSRSPPPGPTLSFPLGGPKHEAHLKEA